MAGLMDQVATGSLPSTLPTNYSSPELPVEMGTPETPPPPVVQPEALPPQPSLNMQTMGDYDPSTELGRYLLNNPTRQSVYDRLQATLATYGLAGQDIKDLVKNSLVQGLSSDEVLQNIRQTPTYKTRFRAITERQKLGLPAISESDVVNTERAYSQIMQQAGLPQGFYDQPEDFTDLLIKDVSPTELKDRVVNGYQVAQQADPTTKGELQRLFGVDDGHLAAFFLDPNKTEALLMKRLTEAQMGAAAVRTGYGQVGEAQLADLAGQGVDQNAAMKGFGELAMEQPLFNAAPGESTNGDISQQDQLAAAFGNQAAAKRRIQQKQQERAAAFSGGGELATNRGGFTGAGSVNV